MYVKQRKYKYEKNRVTSFFVFRAIFYEIKVQLSFKLIAFRLCYPNTFYVEWLEVEMYVKKEEGFCLKVVQLQNTRLLLRLWKTLVVHFEPSIFSLAFSSYISSTRKTAASKPVNTLYTGIYESSL